MAADGSVLARRYGAYLFDLDGTLVDSAPDITNALNQALTAGGYPAVTVDLTRHWVGFGSRVLIEQALTHHHAADRLADGDHVQHLFSVFIAYYRDHIADASRVYPGVEATLQRLTRRGAKLAVVTNKLAGLSVQLLEALRLAHYFGIIVGGDTLPQRKPDAAPAWHACRVIGCTPADSLFIGDSKTDVETARAAGCRVVCLRDGYNHGTPADQLGADAVIDSLIELL